MPVKTKSKKKPRKSRLMKKADIIYSKIIRSKGYCEKCGKICGQLQTHHAITRANMRLRYDLRNGFCLGAGCHKFNKDSAHNDPLGFVELVKKRGDYEYLQKAKNETVTTTVEWYQDNIKRLQEYLNVMEVEYDN
jgi:hypothetical protein